MKSGSIIHRVFTFLKRHSGPSKKDCLFVSLLLLLTVVTKHWLDTNGKTEALCGGHITAMCGPGCRLPAKVRRNRTPLTAAGLLSLACLAGATDNSSNTDDSAVEEGEDGEAAGVSDLEPPSEVACLVSELRRNLHLDDEGDGGFAEPSLCPGQLGLLTLGGEYEPMAVPYTDCSSGLSWCHQPEHCLPLLRDSMILRRESWPFLPGPRAGAGSLGAVRTPTQTWRSVKMGIPHSCYCGSRHHQPEDAQPQPAVAQDA